MKKRRTKMKLLRYTTLILGVLIPSYANAWTLPLEEWRSSGNGYFECANRCNHLGADLAGEPNDEVKSVCAGRVVQALWKHECGNYGGRVLIQCDGTPIGTNVFLYGHLGNFTNDPATSGIVVRENDFVQEGQLIGRLGTTEENGCYSPHLHFAINRGPFQESAKECGKWRYAGYTAEAFGMDDSCRCQILDNWYDPEEVFGMKESDLQILSSSVTPASGPAGEEFEWSLETSRARAPIHAEILVVNPSSSTETRGVMTYEQISPDNNGYLFSYSRELSEIGQYQYRFELETCVDSFSEEVNRSGPTVQAVCRPQSERCDGTDNNCDGMTDNGISTRACHQSCGQRMTGTERCENGQWICDAPAFTEEVCDDIDNDCDGVTDADSASGRALHIPCESICGEGVEYCVDGVYRNCTAPTPRTETCDGEDDEDCDGDIDEGCDCLSGAQRMCGTDEGECRTGMQNCSNGHWSLCQGSQGSVNELCDNRDNDCDGETDEVCFCRSTAAQSCGTDEGECTVGTQTCNGGVQWSACSGRQSTAETCDNLDNDCDAETDEGCDCRYGETRTCGTDEGECRTGTQSCTRGSWGSCASNVAPVAEVCDGLDNDCDAVTDEGLAKSCSTACGGGTQSCVDGAFTQCTARNPSTEVCDNVDNDCDGLVDEQLSRPCSTECGTGTETCLSGTWISCTARQPRTETCNGTDEDCDGQTDEETNRACSTLCGQGTEACSQGRYLACNAPQPETEICDRVDNDCDSRTDEGCECVNGETRTCGPATEGICRSGTERCVNGRWSGTCDGAVNPATELCDGLDNDCDGTTDENLTRSCSTSCGASGQQTCQGGSWDVCVAMGSCTPPSSGSNECRCGAWENAGCGLNGCVGDKMAQRRYCTATCMNPTMGRCAVDASCAPPPPNPCTCGSWENKGCGANSCASDKMAQEKTCTGDCANPTPRQCVVDASCTPPPPPPPPPACSCSDFVNAGCGLNGCASGQIAQTRTCSPSGCESQSKCAWHDGCSSNPPPPPPPPPPANDRPEIPPLQSPANEAILEVPFGQTNTVTLRWEASARAVTYTYEVSFAGSTPFLSGNTANTSVTFSRGNEYRGKAIQWRVKAIGATGLESDWSSRTFFLSHVEGSIVYCNDSACPYNTYYMYTREIDGTQTPKRLILQWMTLQCLGARSFENAPFSYIAQYTRSASRNGCP